MTVGASLFLIALGAILRFAVSDSIEGVALGTIGLILLIVGIIGLVIGLFLTLSNRSSSSDGRYPADRTY